MNIEKLLPADIIGFKTNSWLGRMIRIVSTGKLKPPEEADSHIEGILCLDRHYNKETDALLGGITFRNWRVRPFSTCLKKGVRVTVYRIKEKHIGEGMRKDIVTHASTTIKKGYDFPQIFGLFLRSFLRLLGPRLYKRSRRTRIYLESRQKFICSEIWEHALNSVGLSFVDKAHPSQVTPFDITKSPILRKIARYENGKWVDYI